MDQAWSPGTEAVEESFLQRAPPAWRAIKAIRCELVAGAASRPDTPLLQHCLATTLLWSIIHSSILAACHIMNSPWPRRKATFHGCCDWEGMD